MKNTAQLSGFCMLNFTAAQVVMAWTSIDCWSPFESVLANVIFCPQMEAIIAILIGQSGKKTNFLILNSTITKHCLSDIQQTLVEQGASSILNQICSIRSSNLTEGSCPVKDVDQFESIVVTSELLTACNKIDPVKECCEQTCQSAISEAAKKMLRELMTCQCWMFLTLNLHTRTGLMIVKKSCFAGWQVNLSLNMRRMFLED